MVLGLAGPQHHSIEENVMPFMAALQKRLAWSDAELTKVVLGRAETPVPHIYIYIYLFLSIIHRYNLHGR